jgi:hypothetical protein
VLDRRTDVVPQFLPETIFLRELEEHTWPLLGKDVVVRIIP